MDSIIHIETPEYTVKGTIGDLSSRVVSGEITFNTPSIQRHISTFIVAVLC